MVDDKNICFQAVCKLCKAVYYGLSSIGTGHLQRHRKKCEDRNAKSHEYCLSQTLMVVYVIGSIMLMLLVPSSVI